MIHHNGRERLSQKLSKIISAHTATAKAKLVVELESSNEMDNCLFVEFFI